MPFICLSILTWIPPLQTIDTMRWFISYSAIILSFMAGTLWGLTLNTGVKGGRALMLASNVFAMMAWVALLNTSSIAALTLLSLGYILTLSKEDYLRRELTRTYWQLRLWLTYSVLFTHLLVMAQILIY